MLPRPPEVGTSIMEGKKKRVDDDKVWAAPCPQIPSVSYHIPHVSHTTYSVHMPLTYHTMTRYMPLHSSFSSTNPSPEMGDRMHSQRTETLKTHKI